MRFLPPMDYQKKKVLPMEQMGLYVGILGGLLGAAGVVVSMMLGISYHRRLKKQDFAANVSTEATLKVDIEYIKCGIDDIKTDQRDMHEDFRNLSERVTRVEESVKSAHQRLDQHLGAKSKEIRPEPCGKDSEFTVQ